MVFAALLLGSAQVVTSCAVTDVALPPQYAAWKTPGEAFEPGKAVVLDVTDGATMIGFRVTAAGTYGIALDQKGWIDVFPGATGGEPLKSVSHREGDACWPIRKIVRFDLAPGLYRLQLSKLAQPHAEVMLVAGSN